MNWKSLTTSQITQVTGVDDSTARRYKRQRRAPEPVIRLLSLYLEGRILPGGWAGARFQGERLLVDEAEAYTLGEFRALFWNRQRDSLELMELRRRLNLTLRPRPVHFQTPRSSSPASDSPESTSRPNNSGSVGAGSP